MKFLIFSIRNEELYELNDSPKPNFPKYTSQLINWANQNAQGTRPKVVGQMSELFPEYLNITDNEITLENWYKWYTEKNPDAIKNATKRILIQIHNLQKAIKIIDENMVQKWVEDLVIN